MPDLEKLIMVLLTCGVVFFLFREFFCWYWKQSEQVNLLKDIRASLKRLEAGLPAEPAEPGADAGPAARLPGYTPYPIRPARRSFTEWFTGRV
jgi:hypothetical protein